eukprot:TRINITY_DN6827_c0_g2_i1.p1 TRINITY_DN6827_c0_g2~~TRINITY_DN6827_c0_g2_i1.p1  ORF type:complete len:835 (-),score=154.91 TRINITY_DN6827_c0_g2_i1:108-2573(-)
MCIRDRYQRRVHGGTRNLTREMRKPSIVIILISLMSAALCAVTPLKEGVPIRAKVDNSTEYYTFKMEIANIELLIQVNTLTDCDPEVFMSQQTAEQQIPTSWADAKWKNPIFEQNLVIPANEVTEGTYAVGVKSESRCEFSITFSLQVSDSTRRVYRVIPSQPIDVVVEAKKETVLRYLHTQKEPFTITVLSQYAYFEFLVYKFNATTKLFDKVPIQYDDPHSTQIIHITLDENDINNSANIYEVRFIWGRTIHITAFFQVRGEPIALPAGYSLPGKLVQFQQRTFRVPLEYYNDDAKVVLNVFGGKVTLRKFLAATGPGGIQEENQTYSVSGGFTFPLTIQNHLGGDVPIFFDITVFAEEDSRYEITIQKVKTTHQRAQYNRLTDAMQRTLATQYPRTQSQINFYMLTAVNETITVTLTDESLLQEKNVFKDEYIKFGVLCGDNTNRYCVDWNNSPLIAEGITELTYYSKSYKLKTPPRALLIRIEAPNDIIDGRLSLTTAITTRIGYSSVNLSPIGQFFASLRGSNEESKPFDTSVMKIFQPYPQGCVVVDYDEEKGHFLHLSGIEGPNNVTAVFIEENQGLTYGFAKNLEVGYHSFNLFSSNTQKYRIHAQAFKTCDDAPHKNIKLVVPKLKAEDDSHGFINIPWGGFEFGPAIYNADKLTFQAHIYLAESPDVLPWSQTFAKADRWANGNYHRIERSASNTTAIRIPKPATCKENCRLAMHITLSSPDGWIGTRQGAISIRMGSTLVRAASSTGGSKSLIIILGVTGGLLVVGGLFWLWRKRTAKRELLLSQSEDLQALICEQPQILCSIYNVIEYW